MYKMRTASAFIAANDPLVFLADASEIVIDEDWGTHRATDAEIKELVKDIKGMWTFGESWNFTYYFASWMLKILFLANIVVLEVQTSRYGVRTEQFCA